MIINQSELNYSPLARENLAHSNKHRAPVYISECVYIQLCEAVRAQVWIKVKGSGEQTEHVRIRRVGVN